MKINRGFILYFVADFLPRTICSVLNLCAVLRRPAKIEALRMCCGGLPDAGVVPEPFRSGAGACVS